MNRYTIEGTNKRSGYAVRRIVRAETLARATDRATAEGINVESCVLTENRPAVLEAARNAWAELTRGADGL